MDNKQLQRISKMEDSFNQVHQALQNLEVALANWSEKMSVYDGIVNYYTGEEWMKDYESSNQEGFPDPIDFPHGVLAEDTIFNEMLKHKEIAIKLLKIGTAMLDK